jgi:hypothetical protein
MNNIMQLLRQPIEVVNVGVERFVNSLEEAGVPTISVDWQPPARGEQALVELLDRAMEKKAAIDEANRIAFKRLTDSRPYLVDIGPAEELIPCMEPDLILHAGPPIEWERMCGPMRGAIIGGMIYEGLAADAEEAEQRIAKGKVRFAPCHHHSTVGPMAGVVTASMPVFRIRNETFGNEAYCTLNEGLGKVLRYGAFDQQVIKRLRWMETVLAPTLKRALAQHGPLDLRSLIAQALHMGDECHNRNRAATSLFIREIAPALIESTRSSKTAAEVLRFINGNDHFFLNLSMPACKCMTDTMRGIRHSSAITAMARNGTEFGIRVSALGDRWFTAPAPRVNGLFLPGFNENDANPDIGDSTITETAGLGAFSMAAAPAIVQFVGGSPEDAISYTSRMYEITLGEHPMFSIPVLGFRGAPAVIDLLLIIETGIVPAINTGIAHREPGIGQVGAGLVIPPRRCFEQALRAFVEEQTA